MKAVISLGKKEKSLFFVGYTDELTGKGFGSGAWTRTNRIPKLTEDEGEAKVLAYWADTKRIVAEIIDAIKYKDIEKPDFITVHFLD
jgi:hypothetical protein